MGGLNIVFIVNKQLRRGKRTIGKNVSKVIISVDESNDKLLPSHLFPNKVIIHFNILRLSMKNRIG